ncbi:MAG: ATP-binding protein [Lachnospiraceae bacterium]|nr:ATP-binding protein [Lachnospiraceae bacterium]
MARTISIGNQDFETIRREGYFYIDKTDLIRQWWESGDGVTLITRPRRFGKTLNMSMLEKFFSVDHKDRGDLFCGLKIWESEKYIDLQGTYPVIFLSFAGVKESTYADARESMCRTIEEQYNKYDRLLNGDLLNEREKAFCRSISANMSDSMAAASLRALSDFLGRYYGKKTIILLDEYDTPMQEAYVNGYWGEMAAFTRSLFNATFKTNPYLERAIMTGITRVSKESIFSDLNNLKVVTTTSKKYSDCFGFTEEEVFAVLEEYGLSDQKQKVKDWYDGFSFGERRDIYNPWSIINFLDERRVGAYWANTSANRLVEKLIREGKPKVKQAFEDLLDGGTLHMEIDEQIVYDQLSAKKNAVWSLFLASGYLKVVGTVFEERTGRMYYDLTLTNKEVHIMFANMVQDWFAWNDDYNDFIKALLLGDVKAMNLYMNRVTMEMFSFFDTGKSPQGEPERFYHGFVLGLMVELEDRYVITSNRESGFGRYDVMLEPRSLAPSAALQGKDAAPHKDVPPDAIIIEFKVQDTEETELTETARSALKQIEERDYQAALIARGIPEERIRKYGFAFCGKRVLIAQ